MLRREGEHHLLPRAPVYFSAMKGNGQEGDDQKSADQRMIITTDREINQEVQNKELSPDAHHKRRTPRS